ncbi:FtsX-like permease family protein [Segetibacter sp. 3557_3]|uniref:ABC transporter permease n=1 Tax=Segetibacter sp. 3557_3 TaxID=2547429 RepID=UPI001058524F|nr:ABC transporter permease [Segetibacter sp. 3557_3]TDH27248.1 FtsX-like permease family protein [Segetibacter sp. 3557_3]
MLTMLLIIWNSFKMALQELSSNKLRTFLSLFGITIGIFCIIGVLATVQSLEAKVQSDIKSLGSNTIYIDKWEYGSGEGGSFPWWKYIKRPYPKHHEMEAIKSRSQLASAVCYTIRSNSDLEYEDNVLSGASGFGVSEDFNKVLTVNMHSGRYITDGEFKQAAPVLVMGYTNAENLFGNVERALGKEVKFKGRNFTVIGIIKKQGQGLLGGGWQFDEAVVMPFKMMASYYVVEYNNPLIMVKGKDNVPSAALTDELRGIMRSIHRLSPRAEDDFALNDINIFSEQTSSLFGSVNLGGWAIAGLSLIVGAFGVANIMFVTVRERTSQIGLKKAIGARNSTILTEFLLESAFLCLLGGLIGLVLVFLLTMALSAILPFAITISVGTLTLAISICLIVGVLAGIIPATIAARMNPVVAIRMK